MATAPDIIFTPPPEFKNPPPILQAYPLGGGLTFGDIAPQICGVVDNGVSPDDPRVMLRLNEATKIILDHMIPVGGMMTANIQASSSVILLPPQMENVIEAYPLDPTTKIRGDSDVTQGWYEIVNNSTYLDPNQQHDNPLIDLGLYPDPSDSSVLRRSYQYPGLNPDSAVVVVTGAKRYLAVRNDEDSLIVQNVPALKNVILYIERSENNDPDNAAKYLQVAWQMLEAEVKKHIMDPRNYMRRKSAYYDDLSTFPPNTLGWIRANIAIDIPQAILTGKQDLTWSINQAEKRLMQPKISKDCIVQIQANVVGGIVYFPLSVQSVLAVDLNGCPIPIRSQFFEHLENGPGMFSCTEFLKDLGDEYFPASKTTRRKYKLIGNCDVSQCLNAVCKLRWIEKKPYDLMTIKNYEALRLMMTAKFLEEKEDWQNAAANQQAAFKILDDELKEYLGGVMHTVHVQTCGFGLGDVTHGTL